MVGTPTWNLWQQGLVFGGIFLKLRAAGWTLCPSDVHPSQKAEGAVGPASWLDNHGKRPLPLGAGQL